MLANVGSVFTLIYYLDHSEINQFEQIFLNTIAWDIANSVQLEIIIAAKWTEWNWQLLLAFPSICEHSYYLDANISKTVWDRRLVPITH